MDLIQLSYFKAAAELEHFRKASEVLNITQPSLSQAIAKLEKELGCKLFDRVGRSVLLNDYGKAFYQYATQALLQIEDGRRRLVEIREGNAVDIHLGVTVPEMISDYLAGYLLDHPYVHIHQIYGNADYFSELLVDRTLDFAITIQPVETAEIQWERVTEEEQGILMSRQHPLAQRKSVALRELKNEKFIVNNANRDLSVHFQNYFVGAGYAPNIVFEGEQTDLIGALVAKNHGISLCSQKRFAYHAKLSGNQEIVYIPISEPKCIRQTGFARLRGRSFSPGVESFYEYLKRSLQTDRGQ